MSSESLHEPVHALSAQTLDRHRAIASLREELEAVDWYHQRVETAADDDLRGILAHNRDEEIEHAAMVLEWLRRTWPTFDEQLSTYLNAPAPVVEAEAAAMGRDGASDGPVAPGNGSLGIGSLR